MELLGSSLSKVATDAEGLGSVLRFLVNSLTVVADVFQSVSAAFQAGLWTVRAGLESLIGNLLHYVGKIPGFGSVGKLGDSLIAQSANSWENAERNAMAVRHSGAAALDAGARAFNGSGAQDLAYLKNNYTALDEQIRSRQDAAKSNLEHENTIFDQIEKQRELTSNVDDLIAKKRDELQIARDGADAVERAKLLEEARTIGAEAAVAAKLSELAALDEMLVTLKAQADFAKRIADAARDAATVGMSDGAKYLSGLGADATAQDRADAARLDSLQSQRTIAEAVLEAERERVEMQRKLTLGDAYNADFTSAFDSAMSDGMIDVMEQAELNRLDAILKQNEALDAQLEKRKQDIQFAEGLRKTAADLTLKLDPLSAFSDQYVRLQTMLQGGLIGDDTFASALQDLQNQTLKSAGPKNIGFAKAVEAGSAESYSATLKQTANPEYEELKKQTELQRFSKSSLAAIQKGVERLGEAEQLEKLAP